MKGKKLRRDLGKRAGGRAATVLTAALLGTVSIPGPPARADRHLRVTGKNSIDVFTLNVRYFDFGYRKFADRLVNGYRVAPDLILLQEAPVARMDGFVAYLEERSGIAYSWRHSDPGGLDGIHKEYRDAAIIWRTRRFNLAGVKRWRRFGSTDLSTNDENKCFKRGDRGSPITGPPQLAVRLWDVRKGRHIYVASVHWPAYVVQDQREACITANLARMGKRIDDLGRIHRMTIVGGDLNIPPDDPQRSSGPSLKWRTEVDPNCWYRLLMPDVDDGPTCRRSNHAHLPRAYYDAVRVRHYPKICNQWTHGGGRSPYSEDLDSCTSETRRKDYVLFRYETPRGRPLRSRDRAWSARGALKRAHADRGYVVIGDRQYRYSDHRAVQAVLSYK